ncbi:MAG: ROK family protein [Acidobacteriota bacterium]
MEKVNFIGLDIGGTNLRGGVVDIQGELLHCEEERIERTSSEALFHQLSRLVKKLSLREDRAPIKGVGFGFPGFIDHSTWVVEKSPNLSLIDGVNLTQSLKGKVAYPFYIDNDANVAALGEKICGAGKGCQSLVFLTIGTGLGSGVILNNRIWHGAKGYGGELGHITIEPEGRMCNCGNRGCLETLVSATAIVERTLRYSRAYPSSTLSSIDEKELTSERVYEEAVRGDSLARWVLKETGIYLGIAIANIINSLNIELVVLGGQVMNAGDYILLPAKEEAERRAIKGSFASAEIKLSTLGGNAGVVGAAMLAAQQTGYLSPGEL